MNSRGRSTISDRMDNYANHLRKGTFNIKRHHECATRKFGFSQRKQSNETSPIATLCSLALLTYRPTPMRRYRSQRKTESLRCLIFRVPSFPMQTLCICGVHSQRCDSLDQPPLPLYPVRHYPRPFRSPR